MKVPKLSYTLLLNKINSFCYFWETYFPSVGEIFLDRPSRLKISFHDFFPALFHSLLIIFFSINSISRTNVIVMLDISREVHRKEDIEVVFHFRKQHSK
jgi:hypothetical protein